MGSIAGALSGSAGVVSTVSTPTIENLAMANKDTEYSYGLPAGTKRFKIQNRENGLLKLAFSPWAGTPDYWTIFPGQQDEELSLSASATVTLYLQSTSDTQIAEIRTWV